MQATRRSRGQTTVAREYLRVSQDRDGRSKSTSQQHEENARAVAERGWKLHPQAYRDDGRSASRYARRAREGFSQLINDLATGDFDAEILVVWESSRGSRRTGEWVTLTQLCEENSIRIFVTTHGRDYDPKNARDRRSLLEDAVDSEYESAKTSERIRRNVRAAAEAGRVHGKNLYGYQRIYDPHTRQLLRIEEHPEQGPIVKEAVKRVLAGHSFYEIAKDFNIRGIPPRRPAFTERRKNLGWTPPAVKQMLGMPAYAGKRQHNGKIVSDAQWPPLIEPEEWDKLALILNNPARKRSNDWPAKHLLTGIAVCDVCGAGVIVGKQNQGRKQYDENREPLPREHYYSYLCRGVPGKVGFHTAMKEEYLDRIVVEYVLARLVQPDFLSTYGRKDGKVDAERKALVDEIDEHERYLAGVREQAAARHDLDILFAQEDLIRPKIAEAQRKLNQLVAADPIVVELASSSDVHAAWERLELADKRRILRQMVEPRIKRAEKPGARGLQPERVLPGWRV